MYYKSLQLLLDFALSNVQKANITPLPQAKRKK